MHVLFYIQHFLRDNQAGGTRPWSLCQELVRRGHKVTVIMANVHYLEKEDETRSRYAEEDWDGVRVLKVNATGNFRASFTRRLMNYLSYAGNAFLAGMKVEKPDLVLTSIQPIFTGPVGWLTSFLRRSPFFLEVRDVWPDTAIELGVITSPFLIYPSAWLARFLYKRARQIVTLTPGIAEIIEENGIRSDKICVLPVGLEESVLHPTHLEDVRQKHGWQDKFLVLYTGSHAVTDALETLLFAIERLKGHPEIHIVMIGDGDKKPDLIAYAEDKGLKNVTFLDLMPKKELASYLQATDICTMCLPKGHFWRIFLQNKFFDYMGSGKPIVASLIGTQKEYIEEAGAGLVVPPEDDSALAAAILKLSQSPEMVQEMGERAQHFVTSRFLRENLLMEYVDLLEKTAGVTR
jgi:glycosyltransferase involved in cell wall biosynthesis